MSSDKVFPQILSDLINGCKIAFESVYEMYAKRVYNLAFLFLKDSGWSEDVLQEVFIKLWHNREKLDVNGNLWLYIYVLVKRESLNKLRSLKRSEDCFDKLWNNISHLADCSHEKLVAKELSDTINKLLIELPAKQRNVFILSRIEGLSHKEISEQLNISQNTVKNHMVNALRTIKKHVLNHYLFLI
jgi:RNA polymerase sigma-70 factor (family 1)